jgi:diguanylate cyclase (GGDEF)-like protein
MTLFKQIALVLSLMIVIVLASVMFIDYKGTKKEMLTTLKHTTLNNLKTLSSKIAETGGEPVLISAIIDSEFEKGSYAKIAFISTDTSFHYIQEKKKKIASVPQWFIDFANIQLKAHSKEVSSRWDTIGRVTIIADASAIYEALYQTFTKLLYLFLISVSLSLIILNIMLHFILKPLKRIQYQAEAILKNEFVIETQEPYTTEFREVAHAMNAMVKKVEEIFNKANESAQRNRELLYNDPITKLFNRRYLMLKLPELLQLETKNEGGTLMLIALNGAELLNKQLGRKEADKFFYILANIFLQESKEFQEKVISRINGTEFVLMLPDCDSESSFEIAQNIEKRFENLLAENNLDKELISLCIGIYRYRANVAISDLLTRADNALTQAKVTDKKIYIYEEKESKKSLPKEQWRAIFEESIQKNYIELKFWPTIQSDTKKIVHEVMTFVIDGGEEKHYSYGDFIAPAIHLGVVRDLYLIALENLLKEQHNELKSDICSVRLSNEFLKDSKTISELQKLFDVYAKKLSCRLYFEVSDNFAIQNRDIAQKLVQLFKQYGFGFGINSFTGECSDFSYLKELNPEFIKADASFLLDQTEDSMSALDVVTKSLGIELIASYVRTKEELEALEKLNILKVQGPITDNI